MGLDDLGWRAVAAAVSDIAAMGGRARHVLVAVAGPAATDLDDLYVGVAEAVRRPRLRRGGRRSVQRRPRWWWP